MGEPAGDYHRGEMEIVEQTSTFHGFIGLTKWGSLAIASGLVFLVLMFCTPANFFQAAIAGIILLVLGIFALREKKDASGH